MSRHGPKKRARGDLMRKSIVILGSTGSVGTQTLDVIRGLGPEFEVVGLSANSGIDRIKEQVAEFRPKAVAIVNDIAADELRGWDLLGDTKVYSGSKGLTKLAVMNEADMVVTAVVGSVGIEPTMSAIRAGKDVALANKETLVAAGSTVMDEVRRRGVSLMPIDSEHSAIFQCLNGEKKEGVRRIILTCSGGPFREWSSEMIKKASLSEALKHPTWSMGGKITVDSASLMNKGLEVIEAHWLYGIEYDRIDVLIHPQSIIHSMVEFVDRSIIAQLGAPSMTVPIQYALTYPERRENMALPALDFLVSNRLSFSEPDLRRFPCLKYAYEAGRAGGTLPAVMNAANEVAAGMFLEGTLRFTQIADSIRAIMDEHDPVNNPRLDQILRADRIAKEKTRAFLEKGGEKTGHKERKNNGAEGKSSKKNRTGK